MKTHDMYLGMILPENSLYVGRILPEDSLYLGSDCPSADPPRPDDEKKHVRI
jgi:hypothetical protein